jgi:hypothetical protein
MEDKGKEMSRDFIDRCMMEMYDDAVAKKCWGHLDFVVEFKNGKAHRVRRYFEETLTADSLKP